MKVIIPYKKTNPKSRLSSILTQKEREKFVEFMILDVIDNLNKAGIKNIDILATGKINSIFENKANIIISNLGLNDVINNYLEQVNEPVLIMMADLPLVTPSNIIEIISYDKDLIIAPGKGGGTNILFIKKPTSFYVKYYGASFLTHVKIANENSQSIEVYDSFFASTDIDEPQDLVEIMIHGNGRSKSYLQKKFNMKFDNGRVYLKKPLEGFEPSTC